MRESVFDYVVVGGGAAGCPVAARLSEAPDARVLLLDAGGSDRHPFTRIPAGQMWAFARPDMNWSYLAEPDHSRGGRVDLWPAGKRLGGGSAINGMMFVRGHPSDYDQWAQMGAQGWSFEELLPYFRRLERFEGGPNAWRGGDGPLAVSQPRSPHSLCEAFLDAAAGMGAPRRDDLNAAHAADGAGYVQTSQDRGVRSSTARAYIWGQAIRRRNFALELEATAEKIAFDGRRAVGVICRQHGRLWFARARKGVVLSAGAIATPKLLMLSGVGPEAELRRHGVPQLLALEGVGKNLMEHPGAGINFRIDRPTLTSDLGPIRSPLHALNYLLFRRGPLTTSIGHAHAFVSTRPGLQAPNVQIIFSPLHHTVENGEAKPVSEPIMSLAIGLCRVSGRGQLRLRSASPDATPIIDHELFANRDDLEQLAEGCMAGMALLRAAPFARHVTGWVDPATPELSREQWIEHAREHSFLMFHPAGTCRMGIDDLAVVDARLRVRGLDALWVADASIMPTLPAGNINATCVMIGEKAADLIRVESGETSHAD